MNKKLLGIIGIILLVILLIVNSSLLNELYIEICSKLLVIKYKTKAINKTT